jgi:hypothetical protein
LRGRQRLNGKHDKRKRIGVVSQRIVEEIGGSTSAPPMLPHAIPNLSLSLPHIKTARGKMIKGINPAWGVPQGWDVHPIN